MGPFLSWPGWAAGACAHKAFSGSIYLLPEAEHVWSWFQAPPTTSKAPVHTEPEAAQTLLGPRGNSGPDENKASAAFLGNRALG